MRLKSFLLLSALASSAAVSARTYIYESARPDTGRMPRGEDAMRTTMLAGHNRARAAFGAPPVAWSDKLAADARDYARRLARSGAFEHSDDRNDEGENLWTGTLSAYSYDEMFGHWLEEQQDFRPGVMPNVSRSGNFGAVGHYTQIVWPTTTRVGCATASNGDSDYLVCRYAPAGNVYGERLK